jgi:hypothetical protein
MLDACQAEVVTRLGIVVTTVGRWEPLRRLIQSVVESDHVNAVIGVANQSGQPAPHALTGESRVRWVDSGGGISRGRNDAMAALQGEADLLAFPNDHSWYPAGTLAAAAARFDAMGRPGALAGSLVEPSGPRMRLPPTGTPLNRWTVWRAIEPAMFVAAGPAAALRFREDLGSGGPTPWQAGEGTELLLRLLAAGQVVRSAPELVVRGEGERRSLSPDEWRRKLRSYARGIGYVLRLHQAGPLESAVQVLLPWYRFVRRPASGGRTPAADCLQASIGRFEGRLGRTFGQAEDGAAPLDRALLLK